MSEANAGYRPAPPADFVLPFDLANAGLRGRFARLDAVSTRALAAHPLPEAASRVLAEALVLAALLGSALKLEGRLSLQTKSEGPLPLLVTDYFAPSGSEGGGLRGYARLDAARAGEIGDASNFAALTGEGSLAITIEPKPGAQRYQGLVPLSPDSLSASAEGYFTQSEQLPTMLRLAAGPAYSAGEGSSWRAGGIMVQAVPGKTEGDARKSDDWQRVALFLETLEAVELLDTGLAAERVLLRLFHEDEVRAHRVQDLHFQCTCSKAKLLSVLRSYPDKEVAALAEGDGVIRSRCEFCGAKYDFPFDTLVEA